MPSASAIWMQTAQLECDMASATRRIVKLTEALQEIADTASSGSWVHTLAEDALKP